MCKKMHTRKMNVHSTGNGSTNLQTTVTAIVYKVMINIFGRSHVTGWRHATTAGVGGPVAWTANSASIWFRNPGERNGSWAISCPDATTRERQRWTRDWTPKSRISISEMFSLSGKLSVCAFPPNKTTRHSVDTRLYCGQAMCHALGFVLISSYM